MNYLKTKKITLMLMSTLYVSAVFGAAHQEGSSLWQRTKNFMAEHSVAIVCIGASATAAGAYELAAQKFGLPSISDASSTLYNAINEHSQKEVKLIESDKLGYACLATLLSAGALVGTYSVLTVAESKEGEYPEAIKTICDYAVEHPIASLAAVSTAGLGLQLSYDVARLNGLPPLYDVLQPAMKAFIEQAKKDLVSGGASPESQLSVKDHMLHAVRLYGYFYCMNVSFNAFRSIILSDLEKTTEAVGETVDSMSVWTIVLVAPISEEIMFRYIPEKLFKGKAQFVMPVLFSAAHGQYDLIDKARVALLGLILHRSLQARPEYYYSPIVAHVLNNGVTYIAALGLRAMQ